MSAVPEGWVESTLDATFQFNPKHSQDAPRDANVSFVPMAGIDERLGTITATEDRPLSAVCTGYTHFRDKDVLFAKITPCMENGKAAVAHSLTNRIGCGSTEFHVMRSDGSVEPEYLWRYLRQETFRSSAARSMTGAVGQRRVPLDYLKTIKLPVPPAAEQRRIIAKIDRLSARSKRAREELERTPRLVEHYKRSILKAAFEGRLSSGRLVGWRTAQLHEIADIQSGVALGKKRNAETELVTRPYLRVANVQRGWLKLAEIKHTKVSRQEADRLRLQPGDILMNEGGDRDKLGRGWVWAGEVENCIHQNHVFRVRLKDRRYPPQLISLFTNEFGQDHFLNEGKQTTNLASISKAKLSTLPLLLPPTGEAIEILRRINHAFAAIDRLAAEATSAGKLLDRLDQAVLAKAFRGELVPQDPNDEPASVLLERIRAERAAAPAPKRGRRPKVAAA